nr:DNA-dependent ATPase protein rad54 [Polyrhizophydium stewartii]
MAGVDYDLDYDGDAGDPDGDYNDAGDGDGDGDFEDAAEAPRKKPRTSVAVVPPSRTGRSSRTTRAAAASEAAKVGPDGRRIGVSIGVKGSGASTISFGLVRRKKVYKGEREVGRLTTGRHLGFVARTDTAPKTYCSTTVVFPQAPLPLRAVDPNAIQAMIVKPFKARCAVPSMLVPTLLANKNKNMGSGLRPGTTLGIRRKPNLFVGPLHDPTEPDAVILYEPKVVLTEAAKLELLKSSALGKKDVSLGEVHVVVDPILGRILRPHQVEGVRFLYNCTTGVTHEGAFGCIMADEMGLGKTLQCITLLWTLLRQSPTPGKPTIEKAIIACPSSLVKNWANELKKWLGENRVRPYSCDNKGTKEQTTKDIEHFVSAKGRGIVHPVLIVSYETLRIYSSVLAKTEIGLLLCDEGHRLKNSDSLTYVSLNQLKAKRRVILSGTPIQNDLTEYFSLISFAIPDVLGSEAEFRKRFELPILRGRDADASDKDRKLSEERLGELLTIANKFIIRRTAELLTKYLPIKYEYVVFCKLSEMQAQIYRYYSKQEMSRLLSKEKKGDKSEKSEAKKAESKKGGQTSLKAITTLKKLVNHPSLLSREDMDESWIPREFSFKECQPEYSGKFYLLHEMLMQIKTETNDKIVLISNYTQTLDAIEKMCRSRKWPLCRLDGTMTIQKRQKLVDRFNDPSEPEFIFLLSSKAGGCGINLIGANRLILMDPDWNPANDAQALARVWRDGQTKTCFIYRFIATGTIEEKIFQRQAHKQSLSSCVVDEEQDVERHFSLEALKQLFQYNDNTMSDTHDAFKCKRCGKGRQLIKPPEGVVSAGAAAADTSTWNHFSALEINKVFDHVLRLQAQATQVVTYAFQNKSHDKQEAKEKK